MSDLIEKQAVIDALLSKMDTIDDKPEVVLGLAVAAGMIKAMPSALEQEPCTDAISRQAVLEIIRDFEYKNSHEEMLINSRIKQLQSVTPAEKVGHWIANGETFRCSECGELACCQGRYCNECGAMMQEVEE